MKLRTAIAARRMVGVALLVGGVAVTMSGCIVAPVGPPGFVAPGPVVVAPLAPVVVVHPWYRRWWW